VKRGILLAAMLALAPCRAALPAAAAHHDAGAEPTRLVSVAPADDAIGAGWWQQHKKRFQELAACALGSANLTMTLIVGVSGPAAVPGLIASGIVVLMCL